MFHLVMIKWGHLNLYTKFHNKFNQLCINKPSLESFFDIQFGKNIKIHANVCPL